MTTQIRRIKIYQMVGSDIPCTFADKLGKQSISQICKTNTIPHILFSRAKQEIDEAATNSQEQP